ncbi:hypothetical protein [Chitinibacter tainanensis]|uniref:L,D-transpeptidase Cds6 family protein n=1 Tax=Chitinibacter tainanensis TaxID=230667 RepID=UPI0023564C24|nr:hypothetical protein [Chitinibacter tainanensis]
MGKLFLACSSALLISLPSAVWAAESPTLLRSQSAKAIDALLEQWSSAWQQQLLKPYLASYADTFTPEGGLTLAQWRAQREQRVLAGEFVQIRLREVEIVAQQLDTAEVRFVQDYRSNLLRERNRKTLWLVREHGQWKIQRELAAPAP